MIGVRESQERLGQVVSWPAVALAEARRRKEDVEG